MFGELSPEIVLKIIQKLQPISYVRTRRSSRWINALCEKNRRNIGIRVRNNSTIFLLNSVYRLKTFSQLFSGPNAEDLKEVFVLVNYGKYQFDSNLKVRMTKENVPFLRAAISGFYFNDVILWNDTKNLDEGENFDLALDCFFEVYGDMKPSEITICNISIEQMKKFIERWKPTWIELEDDDFDMAKWNLPVMKNAPTILGSIEYNPSMVLDLPAYISNRKQINLTLNEYPEEILWNALTRVLKDWKNGILDADYARFYFNITNEYFSLDLTKNGEFYKLEGAVHLGHFMMRNLAEVGNTLHRGYRARNFDYWLYSLDRANGQKQIGLIQMIRTIHGLAPLACSAKIILKKVWKDGSINIKLISLLLENHFYNGVLDHSNLINEFKGNNIEDIQTYLRDKHRLIVNFYKRSYRRNWLNVLVDVVKEPWDLARNLLEFKKKERYCEQRSRSRDFGFVLFQEIFCPIYQFVSI